MSPQTTDLSTALQWHLPWHKARVKFIAAFVLALIQVTTVNLVRIANGLNGTADRKSNYRRIQRFLALFDLDYDLLAEVVVTLLPPRKDWLITLDRTHWQFGQLQINILLVGIVFQGVAFPLYWTMLPKKGNSNTQERIALMEPVLALLGPERIRAVVCDREFIGQAWLQWLDKQGLTYHIRIRENAVLPGPKPSSAGVYSLPRSAGRKGTDLAQAPMDLRASGVPFRDSVRRCVSHRRQQPRPGPSVVSLPETRGNKSAFFRHGKSAASTSSRPI